MHGSKPHARASTDDQLLDAQTDALTAAGAERIFADKISGSTRKRPQLDQLLDQLRHIYRRPSDNKWVDKRNDANRGFTFDTQAAAIASGREKLVNAGGGELRTSIYRHS